MNDWYMDAFDWSIFDNSIVPAFQFIFTTIQQLFSAIFKQRFIFIPLFLILLLSVMGFVGWLIMESAQYVGGSNYANPNRQFGRMANPNRQYETKMPLWSSIIMNAMRKYDKNQKQKEQDLEREKAMYEKLVKKDWEDQMKRQRDNANRLKADEYFKNNPNAFKINIDGVTFWRNDWEKHRWDKDGRMRHTITYKRVGDGYIQQKETHSVTEYDDPD